MQLSDRCTLCHTTPYTLETAKSTIAGKCREMSYRVGHALNRQTTRYIPHNLFKIDSIDPEILADLL